MFEGLVNENVIEGTVVLKAGITSGENNWIAKRDPSTVIPLDDTDAESY